MDADNITLKGHYTLLKPRLTRNSSDQTVEIDRKPCRDINRYFDPDAISVIPCTRACCYNSATMSPWHNWIARRPPKA
jgi:hypothetical protein